MDKLGVAPGMRVAAVNVSDQGFIELLSGTAGTKPAHSLQGIYDLIFLQIDAGKDLSRIERAAEHLTNAGALWVLHPKGKSAVVKDAEVREVYLSCGLVDNKVSSYNETHTATRCVIPVVRRKRRG